MIVGAWGFFTELLRLVGQLVSPKERRSRDELYRDFERRLEQRKRREQDEQRRKGE